MTSMIGGYGSAGAARECPEIPLPRPRQNGAIEEAITTIDDVDGFSDGVGDDVVELGMGDAEVPFHFGKRDDAEGVIGARRYDLHKIKHYRV
jgi:hypothetical protein